MLYFYHFDWVFYLFFQATITDPHLTRQGKLAFDLNLHNYPLVIEGSKTISTFLMSKTKLDKKLFMLV